MPNTRIVIGFEDGGEPHIFESVDTQHPLVTKLAQLAKSVKSMEIGALLVRNVETEQLVSDLEKEVGDPKT